jgi:hypothetical protein
MNPYIESLAEEIVSRYIEHGIGDDNKLISKVRDELYEIKSETDKLGFLTKILEANETEYQEHLKDCTNIKTCGTNKKHQRIAYYLQQELADVGFEIPNDSFTSQERDEMNEKLDSLIEAIIENDKLVQNQIDQLKQEIEELKSLYIIGKKNWKQLLLGKTGEMVVSGVVSEGLSKPLFELGKTVIQNLIDLHE